MNKTTHCRSNRITFRVTKDELKFIQDKIQDTNYTMSDYIRNAVLDKEILVIEGIEELAKQLRGVGRNLNQLTMLANKGVIKKPNIDEVENQIKEIWSILNIIMTKRSR